MGAPARSNQPGARLHRSWRSLVRAGRSSPPLAVVDELQGGVDVVGAFEQRDDLLQIVTGLRTHAHLVAGDLGLDRLGALVPDEFCDLLRSLAAQALLQGGDEAEL